jgi:hypothetical protein
VKKDIFQMLNVDMATYIHQMPCHELCFFGHHLSFVFLNMGRALSYQKELKVQRSPTPIASTSMHMLFMQQKNPSLSRIPLQVDFSPPSRQLSTCHRACYSISGFFFRMRPSLPSGLFFATVVSLLWRRIVPQPNSFEVRFVGRRNGLTTAT